MERLQFLLQTNPLKSNQKETTIYIYKARTEKAAMSVEGVSKADWSKETKKLAVEFNETKTDIDRIEIAIANVGHDTLNHKAKEEVYNKLPDECKYREKEKTD